jgi:hypothetical protein
MQREFRGRPGFVPAICFQLKKNVDARAPAGSQLHSEPVDGRAFRRVKQFHRLCFAQMARGCSSVANSPRSACRGFVKRRFLIGAQLKYGLISSGQLQKHAGKVILHFRRKTAHGLWSWFNNSNLFA